MKNLNTAALSMNWKIIPGEKAIFHGLKRMMDIRRKQPAFSPYAPQKILELGDHVFALKRENEHTGESVYLVVNVRPNRQGKGRFGIKRRGFVYG
ncbi:hypothetical protein Cdeb_01384 [Caldibacillus debilis GB1]|uniref:Uncharacterized protein n=1 Tax=Caldibacillus debilis GB1 TaxID=1339248 RepID=A0A420VD17_9BACI|nr:hypothetical protein Cdeb_01384 [Caldibacillus debilis GB1]